MSWNAINRFNRIVLITVGTAVLAGCAGYDLEVDAPILNKVGLVGDQKKKAPPLKERAPLIVPPSAQLPTPGTVAQAPQDLNWPDDPDQRAKKIAELKAAQKAAEDKKKGPWNKALNDMLGTSGDQNEDGNPVPPGAKKGEPGSLDELASEPGAVPDVDMEKRVDQMIR